MAETLPSFGDYVNNFVNGAQETGDFPLSYWQKVAHTARMRMGDISDDREQPSSRGGGFPPTDYDMQRIYGTTEPACSEHTTEPRYVRFPKPEQFDGNGCYATPGMEFYSDEQPHSQPVPVG